MENKIREYEQKIELLEQKVSDLEKHNADLRECLLKITKFSTKLSNITYEMDCLLAKKGNEIRDLEKKLAESFARVKDEVLTDFEIEMTDHGFTEVADSTQEAFELNLKSTDPKDYVRTLEYRNLWYTKPVMKRDSKGNFKFPDCDLRTLRLYNCEMHFLIHTDEKSVQWKLCAKSFRYQSDCLGHIRSHNDRMKLNCTICDAKYARYTSSLRHTETKHNGEGYTRKKRKFFKKSQKAI